MGKFRTALFFLIVAVALCVTVNTYAEAPVWDDFPDVKLLLGDVNPIDIELAQYVYSTTTDVFTFTSTTSGITISATSSLGGSKAGTNPGTGGQNGSAFPELPGSLAGGTSGATDVTLVATNDQGSTEEQFRLKYSAFAVNSPRMGSDNLMASAAAPSQFTFTHIMNATEPTVGGVLNRNYGLSYLGTAVNPNQLSWSAMINRVAIAQLTSGGASVDRSVNSAERRMSIFPLAPRSNPVVASSITGIGVFVGNDGHYELTPHAAFTAPVLIGIRGDDAAGGPPDLGYDGTFIFAAPQLTGNFSYPVSIPGPGQVAGMNGPIAAAREFSWEGITANTAYQLGVFAPTTLNKWLMSRADGNAQHSTVTGQYSATVVALSGLSAGPTGPANAANQFPGAAAGNVLRVTCPSDTGLSPVGKPYLGDTVELRMFYLSMDITKGGIYTFSGNIATNCAAARTPSDVPRVALMIGSSPNLFEFAYNEVSAQGTPRDGKWMTLKTTIDVPDAMFNYTDPETGRTGQPEYAGMLLYLGVISPGPNNRATAFQGAEVYMDNLRVYPSEFDLDLALGSTEVPWSFATTNGVLGIQGNAAGFKAPMLTAHGDVEAVAGSGATLADNFPEAYANPATGQVGDPALGSPGIDITCNYGTNNFVTPDLSGANGHSVALDPQSRGALQQAGGSVFMVFDPHSYAPTKIFAPAILATRAFIHTNEALPYTVGHFALVILGTGRTDGAELYPFYASETAALGIPNQAGVWRQMTIEHPWTAGAAQNLPVTGLAGNFAHATLFLLFSQSAGADAGLNATLQTLGQAGGQNIFGPNGDHSPGGAADVGKVFVDDVSHHRVGDAVAFFDDSLFE